MYCKNCGTHNPERTKYCSKCCSDMSVYGTKEPPLSSAPSSYGSSRTHYSSTYRPYYGYPYTTGTYYGTSYRPSYDSTYSSYYGSSYGAPHTSSYGVSYYPYSYAVTEANNYATASLIMGILSIITSFFFFGIILGIAAIILGMAAKNKGCTSTSSATAGIVCGAIGCAWIFILIVFAISAASLFPFLFL